MPADRLSFYEWLVSFVAVRRRCKILAQNISLTAAEMNSHPAIIKNLLEQDNPDGDDKRSVAVIDLAENPYHLIRDVFLYHVADVAHRWVTSRPGQTVVILVPGAGLPPPASLFWYPLPEEAESERLQVIANDGTMWPGTAERASATTDYVRQRTRSRKSLTELLEMKIVRKPGHFDLGGGSGSDPGAHCTRYFFETAEAEQEIGELIVEWAERTLLPRIPAGEPLTLVSHGRESPSFHDAVAGAATALGCAFCKLVDDDSVPYQARMSGWVAPVLNVVNTGGIFRRILHVLDRAGASIAPEALAVMVTERHFSSETVRNVHLSWLCGPYNREKTPRRACDQCRLGLPHTATRYEEQIGLRSFDMWSLLLAADWKKESFGAPQKQRYASLPDLRQVFSRHGNYFAYKVHCLLKNLGADHEVVFVCPAEASIEELIVHLGILLQNQQVTVRVPPAIIRGRNLTHELDSHGGEEWHRQLRHLRSQHFPRAVIIDELAGSKATADGLARLLRSFDLEPFAYVPIIDFSPARPLPGVPTYPLYRIPYPRSQHG